MGAVSFLTRRVGAARAQQIMTAGRVYTAAELHELDLVDVVAPEGKAFETARRWMLEGGEEKWRRRRALVQFRKHCFPLQKDELTRIVELWTDCSLSISAHDMRYMERLVAAQRRLTPARQKHGTVEGRPDHIVAAATQKVED
jgi:DSF synthase